MIARIAVPVVASVALFAGAAMAAGQHSGDGMQGRNPQMAAMTSMAEKCTSLEQQTATAIKEHASAKMLGEAKKMQAEGRKLCASENKDAGIRKLQQALRDLGVKPQY